MNSCPCPEELALLGETEASYLYSTAIVPVDRAALATFQKSWEDSLAELALRLNGVVLSAPEQRQWLSDRIADCAREIQAVEDERKSLVRPLIDDKRRIDELYKTAELPAETMLTFLKRKLAEGETAAQAARDAKLAEISALAAGGEQDAVQDALEALEATTKVKGTSTTFKWRGKLVDLQLVPREYLEVNWAAVADLCKTFDKSGASVAVPGLTFYQDAVVKRTRSAKND